MALTHHTRRPLHRNTSASHSRRSSDVGLSILTHARSHGVSVSECLKKKKSLGAIAGRPPRHETEGPAVFCFQAVSSRPSRHDLRRLSAGREEVRCESGAARPLSLLLLFCSTSPFVSLPRYSMYCKCGRGAAGKLQDSNPPPLFLE